MNKLAGANCQECPLQATTNTCVETWSDPKKRPVLIAIGESPGSREASKGEPFVGPTGQLTDQLLAPMGIEHSDVVWGNAVACFPRRKLSKEAYDLAMHCCSGRLNLDLEKIDAPDDVPVVALGVMAQKALGITLRDRWVGESLTGRWCIGTVHPAYTMREPDDFIYLVRALQKVTLGRGNWPQPPKARVVWPSESSQFLMDERWYSLMSEYPPELSDFELPDLAQDPFFSSLAPNDLLCLDLETDQVDWRNDLILLFGLSKPTVPGEDPRKCGTEVLEVTREVLYSREGREWLRELFERYGDRIGGHNLKFDMLFMHEQCSLPSTTKPGWDTILMLSVLHETWLRNLKEAVTYWFDVYDYEKENVSFLKSKMDSFNKIPPPQLTKYLVYDVHWNLMLAYQLREELQAKKLRAGGSQWDTAYLKLVHPLSHELTQIEFRGVAVDMERVEEEWAALTKELSVIRDQVEELTEGKITNPNSVQQCANYVYGTLGLPTVKIRGLSPTSTAKAALEVHKGRHPFIDVLRHQRRVQKIKGSYFGQLRKFAQQDAEGVWRVFPRYLQYSVRTGRLSARDPSIQTIPRADDREEGQYGKRIKDCLIPKPGWVMYAVDGSQWELRVVSVLSGDPYLLQTYRDGKDFHGAMCDVLFGEGRWGKEDRAQEKRIMFAYVYGGTLESSLNVYEVDRTRKAEMGERFNTQLGGLVAWRTAQFEKARRQGYLETPLGRRFHFQLITDFNQHDVAKWTVNYPVQGTASDITLLGSMRAGPRLRAIGSYPLISIHDSLIGECPVELLDESVRIVAEELERAGSEIFPQVPWVAEAEVGYRWGSLKEVNFRETAPSLVVKEITQ